MAEPERRQTSIININEEYEGETRNELIDKNLESHNNEEKVENSYSEPIEKRVPESEKKIEETLSKQKVIQKKKPKKKGFSIPSTSETEKAVEPQQNLASPTKKTAPTTDNTNQQHKQQPPKPEISNAPVQTANRTKNPAIQSKPIIKDPLGDPLTQSVPKKTKKKKNIDPLSSLSASSNVTRTSNAQPISKKPLNDPLSILGGTDLQNNRKTIAAPTNNSSKISIEKPKPAVKNLFEEDEEIDVFSNKNNVDLFKSHNKATSSIMFSNPSQNINKAKTGNIFEEEEDDRLSLRISAVPQNVNNQNNMRGSNFNNSGTNPFQPAQNQKTKNKLQFLFEDDN